MAKQLKKIPKFKSEDEERKFWDDADTSEYFDWANPIAGDFQNLKPSTETISIRLPSTILADLKYQAGKIDVPYQSLMKVILSDWLEQKGISNENMRSPRP